MCIEYAKPEKREFLCYLEEIYMAISTTKTCPRKAFLRNQVPAGVIKASILRKAAKDILLETDFSVSRVEMEKRARRYSR